MKGKISRQRTASLAGAEESAVQSSLVQSEVSTQDSAEVSVSSETESKAEESVTAEKSFGIKAGKSSEPKTEDTSTEDKTSTTDVGAGEISIKEASSDNMQLSFGNFIVTIGNKTVTLSGAYVVDGIDAVIDGGEWSSSENNGVMLYQSMSGDAADSDATGSVSTLTMTNTTITSELDEPMFYITNTSSVINLNGGNNLTAKLGNLVSAGTGKGGNNGSNGGKLTLNISGESYRDSITADDISSVTVNLSDGAEFIGSTSGSVTVQ